MDFMGTEPFQSPLIPGAGSPGPPGPPCRPTGPSTRALLLTGVKTGEFQILTDFGSSCLFTSGRFGPGRRKEHLPSLTPHSLNTALRPESPGHGSQVPQSLSDLTPLIHHPRQGPDSSDPPSQVRAMFPHTSQDTGKFKTKTVKFISSQADNPPPPALDLLTFSASRPQQGTTPAWSASPLGVMTSDSGYGFDYNCGCGFGSGSGWGWGCGSESDCDFGMG